MLACAGLIYVSGWVVLALTPGQRGLWTTTTHGGADEGGRSELSWAPTLFIFGGRVLSWGGFGLGAGVPAIYLVEVAQVRRPLRPF
jgi:hypothetical protein|eukprot:COSAG01_NODE_2107_length_8406_cov_21.249158_3_plen_86_part_00